MPLTSRRGFLAGSIPWSLVFATIPGGAWADASVRLLFGPARPFNFDWLRARAQSLSGRSYTPVKETAADLIRKVDFDTVQKIKFRADCSLWGNGPESLPLRFFHLDQFVPAPVTIHAIEGNQAYEILYSPRCFDYGDSGLGKILPADLGYSGFRVMNGRSDETDWLAFQGASYFRSAGAENQYGASARGIAINTALSTQEEFPTFTEFWIAEDPKAPATATIYALLEGPSVTGAYKFTATRTGNVVIDVHAELFCRADITRLGIAPLTSMYWYGENERRHATDWRPEIHDSDGLAMWTGKGERIWRPLINPPMVQTNSFLDSDPRGFGLMQRDRDFDHYQDDGAFYNRRPSIWIEPRGRWGDGAVQLVEIPTDDEYHDNIVVYWQPHQPVTSGTHLPLDYRLYWQDDEPHLPVDTARVVATRIGRYDSLKPDSGPGRCKFVIDFEGGSLSRMAPRYDMTPVVTLSRGTVDKSYVIKIVGTDRWRAVFNITVDGNAPLDMRCFLRLGDKTLSETWLYQYFPVA